MDISDLLPRLLELLHLKATPIKKFQKMERLLLDKKATNDDRLEELKKNITRIERQVLAKRREYESARGDTRRIVGGEIERLFERLDRSRGQEVILARNLGQIGLGLAKIAEILVALNAGVDGGVLDVLALELQDIFGEMKKVDQEAEELEKIRYSPPQSESIDIDVRMAALETNTPETQTATPQGKSEAREGLSQASLDRMRELDAED